MRKAETVIISLALNLLLSGCIWPPVITPHELHLEMEADRNRVAIVYGTIARKWLWSPSVQLKRIDGFAPKSWDGTPMPVEIPPGEHTVTISFDGTEGTLTFVAEPGRRYAPLAQKECGDVWYWIEEWGPYDYPGEVVMFRVWPANSEPSRRVVAGSSPEDVVC